jgi:hypothetical protein
VAGHRKVAVVVVVVAGEPTTGETPVVPWELLKGQR